VARVTHRKNRAEWQRFLVVDDYLGDAVHVAALATAFDCGLIDALLEKPRSIADLARACGREPERMRLLVDLLAGGKALAKRAKLVSLRPGFAAALEFRDLLEAKVRYSPIVLGEIGDRFSDLVFDFPAYTARSRAFALFRYHAGKTVISKELADAEPWVSLTTVLTRYEAAACLAHFDFAGCRRILDVGGNSGELARRICERHPEVRVDVFDLPVICEIGRRHVGGSPEADRIGFVAGDARSDDLPAGYDACIFKSMLHDWPDADAQLFLEKALGALAPGGRLLVFERTRVAAPRLRSPVRSILSLPFWPCFREARTYVSWLRKRGATDVAAQRIELDMDFMLVTATAGTERPRPRAQSPAAPAASDPTLLRFRHEQEDHALDLFVEPFVEGNPSFAVTGRFALSYRPWPATNAVSRPRVAGMLALAQAALSRADQAGLTIEQARQVVASSALGGWVLDKSAAR